MTVDSSMSKKPSLATGELKKGPTQVDLDVFEVGSGVEGLLVSDDDRIQCPTFMERISPRRGSVGQENAHHVTLGLDGHVQ